MARKRRAKKKVSKSQAIRDFTEAFPEYSPTQIVSMLKRQGITVTPAYVSQVKSATKKKEAIALSSLLAAKKFVEKIGGVEEAQAALAAIAQLQ